MFWPVWEPFPTGMVRRQAQLPDANCFYLRCCLSSCDSVPAGQTGERMCLWSFESGQRWRIFLLWPWSLAHVNFDANSNNFFGKCQKLIEVVLHFISWAPNKLDKLLWTPFVSKMRDCLKLPTVQLLSVNVKTFVQISLPGWVSGCWMLSSKLVTRNCFGSWETLNYICSSLLNCPTVYQTS